MILAAIGLEFLWVRSRMLRRGIPQYGAVPAAGKLKEKGGAVLLDVRTAGERKIRAIGGSLHIPLSELAARLPELEKLRDREIICYCQSGARSLRAAHLLKSKGFRAANLSGGISAWKEG